MTMIYNLIATICVILFIAYALRVLEWIWFRPKKLEKILRQQGFRGNSYSLLVGDLQEGAAVIKEANSKPINLKDDIVPRVIPLAYYTLTKYGEKSFTWAGQIPRLHITNPHLAKEIISKFHNFQKSFKTNNPLIDLLITGVIAYEGEKWSKHRRILNPGFQLEKLKHMLPAFHSSASDMLSEWEKIVSAEGSGEVNIWPHLEKLSADGISRTAFGRSYVEGKKIFKLLKDLSELSFEAMQSVYVPGLRFLPTTRNNRMKQMDREVEVLITDVINDRVKEMKGGASPDDILGILLRSNLQEMQHGKNSGMSIRDVVTECKLFYFAGQETSSILLCWTMILLSMHPLWQARAREEVFKVFGNENPNYEGISHLKTVNMILNEVLRLYPPVAELTRIVREDTKLGDLFIPAGVQIMVLTILLHHDREIWGEDAKEFNPERFAEGVAKATNNQFAYLPFGWGPRICIGQNFALLEVKVALSMILQRFSFELSSSYVHAPFVIITLQPQFGAHLILHKLQS